MHNLPSLVRSRGSERLLSTFPLAPCRFHRDTQPSTACPREQQRPRAPNGELGFTQMICLGWKRTFNETLMPGAASTGIVNSELYVHPVTRGGSRRAASFHMIVKALRYASL